jgi:hypothetical protein
VDLGKPVQDGGGADPQAQRAGDSPHQVTGLQRRRPAKQADQPGQLAALRALPLGLGDLVQALEHGPDLQGRHPVGVQLPEQLLGGQAEIADLAGAREHLLGRRARGLGDRPGGQPLGHPQLHPGEVGGDLALAQQRHRRQQVVRGLPEQLGQPFDQRDPPTGALQVPIGLGEDLVAHPSSSPVRSATSPSYSASQVRRISASRHGPCAARPE